MKRAYIEHNPSKGDQVSELTGSSQSRNPDHSTISTSREKKRLRPVYLGPGYGTKSSPYCFKKRKAALNEVSGRSTETSITNSLASERTRRSTIDSTSKEKKEETRFAKPAEPTLTALHMLDILKKLKDKRKVDCTATLNPYYKDTSAPPLFSAKSLDQNMKFINEMRESLRAKNKLRPDSVKEPTKSELSSQDTLVPSTPILSPPSKTELTALDILSGKLPSDF